MPIFEFTIPFDGRILVLGCGSVSQCTVPLLVRHIDVPPDRITVLDMVDRRETIADAISAGVNFRVGQVTEENHKTLLAELLGAGDLFVDLSWNVETLAMLDWCHHNGVRYINTSVEEWNPYDKVGAEFTLYARQMKIRELIAGWNQAKGPTAVVDHGANPGLVSHFTKMALLDIAEKIVCEKPHDERVSQLEAAIETRQFNQLAMLTGVRTIHISERDTQVTDQPKRINEFVNTWSIEGLYEEGTAPAEMGWGTHEKRLPPGANTHLEGPQNQIFLDSRGMETWVQSWVPCGPMLGMVIRHGEAFSISDRLTVYDESGEAIYRPTVHYAYCPADAAIASLHELRMRDLDLQADQRILGDEITHGRDELGCLLLGHDFGAWWIGSLLDINETRELVGGQNPTTLQVASSVLGCVVWMIRNPDEGVNLPDDLPHEEVMEFAMPYLGPFVSEPSDWRPLSDNSVNDWDDLWQFETFLVK
ncbi:MAG: saccharopine dehydrogenase NADP-binding domain-containing protein [Planctomycetota bacterium]|nr:saccharopine dehydrogenase NADP-binding domain-containing protein [Planctomycetota bacterium]MDA1252242.1 saccharopine dehydrogenase NADP-binding domain-containing protein [Planctomycetota bacterium]